MQKNKKLGLLWGRCDFVWWVWLVLFLMLRLLIIKYSSYSFLCIVSYELYYLVCIYLWTEQNIYLLTWLLEKLSKKATYSCWSTKWPPSVSLGCLNLVHIFTIIWPHSDSYLATRWQVRDANLSSLRHIITTTHTHTMCIIEMLWINSKEKNIYVPSSWQSYIKVNQPVW